MQDLGIDGRIILKLKQVVKKQDGRAWNGFIWPRIGTSSLLM